MSVRVTLALSVVLVVGCGGESGSVGALEDATTNETGTHDGSSTSDGSNTLQDGGSEASTADGSSDGSSDVSFITDGGLIPDGAPSNPDQITCGTTQCSLQANQVCCAEYDAGVHQTCKTGTCGGGPGAEIACDEAADCQNGQVCCYSGGQTGGGFSVQATCQANCQGGAQACKTQSECISGSCAIRTCIGGFKVQTCEAVGLFCL